MRFVRSTHIQYVVASIATLVLFLGVAHLSQMNQSFLENITAQASIVGVVSYICMLVLAVVIAPVSTFFLLPVAAVSYGPMLAAVYTIVGWTMGSMIAFYLARRFGLRWVGKIERVQQLRAIEAALPRRHVFFIVMLLRTTRPVDILSYALGIFSSMSYRSFFLATMLGIAPFTFLLTHASVSTLKYQISVFLIGCLLFAAGAYYVYTTNKKVEK